MAKHVNVIVSPKAGQHLDEIARYIEQDSPVQAKKVVAKILSAIERLERFPEFGSVVPEFEDDSIREFCVFKYRVIHKLTKSKDTLHVIGIIHGMRLLNEALVEKIDD